MSVLRLSGLLSESKIQKVGELPTAAETAKRFVELGYLTEFQTKRLMLGKTDGFYLGSYVILEPLSETSAKKVYRARHRTMNRVVAIKLLTPERTQPQHLRDAFQTATRTAVRLLHPNIVTTFDADQTGNCLYAVQEYVPSQNLKSLLRQTPIPVPTVCTIARQIALALQHAHDHGIVHGRLNPDNVLVSDSAHEPHVKVLNFGYGQLNALDANDATGQLDFAMANADYLAPETFDPANRITPSADLFSLGCLIHALLTGQPPIGDRPIHQFSNRLGVDHWRPGLAVELVQLVSELLNQDPRNRPATAEAVAARLALLSRGRGVEELALPLTEPTQSTAPLDSPFVGLERDTVPEMCASATVEIQPTPRKVVPSNGWQWSDVVAYGIAAAVILATGSAIAIVLRSMLR